MRVCYYVKCDLKLVGEVKKSREGCKCEKLIYCVKNILRYIRQLATSCYKELGEGVVDLRPAGQLETPSFPGLDRTETGPGSGNIFKNIFGSGRVGSGNFILGWSRSGYFFFTGV